MIKRIQKPNQESGKSTHKALYINGEWISGYGKEFSSADPYNGETVWSAPAASASDVTRAVRSAARAFSSWAALSLKQRIAVLQAFKKQVEEASPALTQAISKETGKPLWEAATEVSAMMGKVDISIQAYGERCPEKRSKKGQTEAVTKHRPHGVLAVLGPFNFPGHLPNGHIVPALLAGNTIVFKASEQTPMVAEIMIQCWEKAKIPPGVINLLQGGAEIGKTLSKHEEINGLLFTGSYGTGQKLMEIFAKTPEKILALEMGGNNPLIVWEPNNLEAAAIATIQSAYLTAGQRCTCARRLIIPDGKEGEAFLNTLIPMIRNIKIGHYLDKPEPFMGPVISQPAAVKAISKQASWELKGGRTLLKMQHLQENTGRVTPGLVDVTEIEDREDSEIFAPLLQVIRATNFEAAIKEANATNFGLSAGLLSDSEKQYELFYRFIRAGVVNWNLPITGASSDAPFGGIGRSGNFRPSAYYAADYCAYPEASMKLNALKKPEKLPPGLSGGA